MTTLTIRHYPDTALATPCRPVERFDDDLRVLADGLLAAMRAAPGIGITAAHVGVPLRLVVIDIDGRVRRYCNPVVEWASDERTVHPEGSVSMPGVSDLVERPARVRVRHQNLDGEPAVEDADGLLAVCLQHEIDQLDGIFWLQRLSRLRRDRVLRRYAKIKRIQSIRNEA
ncbi:peptide deformylase-like protein [Allostella sp. ATCC 35155]|nr:peptide deformylase-like protein [Stella sp. ATCC 35155]